jgi:hypothetical protein
MRLHLCINARKCCRYPNCGLATTQQLDSINKTTNNVISTSHKFQEMHEDVMKKSVLEKVELLLSFLEHHCTLTAGTTSAHDALKSQLHEVKF